MLSLSHYFSPDKEKLSTEEEELHLELQSFHSSALKVQFICLRLTFQGKMAYVLMYKNKGKMHLAQVSESFIRSTIKHQKLLTQHIHVI